MLVFCLKTSEYNKQNLKIMTRVNFMNNTDLLRDAFSPKAFSHMFDSLLHETQNEQANAPAFRPRVDVLEREKTFELQAYLPGVKKENIKVEMEGRKLTISGERKAQQEEEGLKYHSRESFYGSFSRSFNMPKDIDTENIEARFEDGVLYLVVEKVEPTKTGKVIEVK